MSGGGSASSEAGPADTRPARHTPPRRQNVCAIVVTYEPDEGIAERIAGVQPQVARLLVVDNGSSSPAREILEGLAVDSSVDAVFNGRNLGVAAAYNQGIEWASTLGHDWVLLLDQDSRVDDGMVRAQAEVHEAFGEEGSIAVIGAGYRDPTAGDLVTEPRDARLWIEAATVISSGSLVSLAACAAAGPMRDELFIDYVDHEFCLRMRAHGYRVLLTTRPLMRHSIGRLTRHGIGGVSSGTTNHPAARRYFRARNQLAVYREYWRREPGWLLRDAYMSAKNLAQMCLFESQRGAKLRSTLRGYRDGLRGRLGGPPEDAPRS